MSAHRVFTFLVLWAATVAGASPGRAAGEPLLPAVDLTTAGNPALAPATESIARGDYARACDDLGAMVSAAPADPMVRGFFAIALLGAGRQEQARQQMSVAACWKPGLVRAYTVRAIVAAQMGAVARAREDLAIARQLDPEDKFQARAAAEKRVEEVLARMPRAPAGELHAALLRAARGGETLEQLVPRAVQLLQASNARRLLGDETYADRYRQLVSDLTQHPRDPDRIAACASFLLDEIDPRNDWVESPDYPTYYRLRDAALQQAELELARKMLVSALALNPSHVPSLAGLARIEFRARMWANAESYLRRALASGKPDRQVLWMMRDIMQVAAAQNVARSIQLRTVRRWEEDVGNYVYEYEQLPSAADLARAEAHEATAVRLLHDSRDYLRQAVRSLSSDAASHDFVACFAARAGDWEAARISWEKAIKLAPAERAFRYSLSNACARLNRVDEFVEHATVGRNLEHTTAATQIRLAWRQIQAGEWELADRQLAAAVGVDPGDPRTIACLAVLAEARGQLKDALALFRAALALEEAHARQRGCSWLTGAGVWTVNDIGRAIALRSRIAELTEADDPPGAAGLYLANVALESRIADAALKQAVFSAMLSYPNLPGNRRQDAPRFGELLRIDRARAAVLLVQLHRYPEAAEHFRQLPGYDARTGAAGARAFERLRDGEWRSRRVTRAAVECFERLGDQQALYGWRALLQRSDPSAPRAHYLPTSPQPAGGTRR